MTNFILSFAATVISFISISQVQTLENGVIVHPAVGMENQENSQINLSNQQRTISEWNLSECNEALQMIQLKCQEISLEECNNSYSAVTIQIQARIESLTSQSE
jgi:hypothetical protein